MQLEAERNAIVRFGRKLIEAQLTTGAGGNLSIFNREAGLVAIKPSGVDYFEMQPEDVTLVNPDGAVVEGTRAPSSELEFHLALYRHRRDASAVVHTHQVYATTLACLNWELPAVHYLVGLAGDKVPLAAYATYGSRELAENIIAAIGACNACLMANHGLVTIGPTLARAFNLAEQLELMSRLYYQAKCIGSPVILSEEEMRRVRSKFQSGKGL